MTRWHPSLDLARLLDALSEEILAMTDEEVRQTAGLQGWNVAGTALEIRALISAARSDVDGNLDQSLSEDLSEPGAGPRPMRRPRSSSHNQPH